MRSLTKIDWEQRRRDRAAVRSFRQCAEAFGSPDDFDGAEAKAIERRPDDQAIWRILHPR